MDTTTTAGIDYGMGLSNVDHATGIRYGVIARNSLDYEAFDFHTTPTFAGPNCPRCGDEVMAANEVKHPDLWVRRMDRDGDRGCFDHACLSCRAGLDSGECWSEEADGWECDLVDYDLTPCLGTNVMILCSPYYTHTAFCSPCVPGAGDLDSPRAGGVRTFCLGHEWFDGGVAPYSVFRVADDSEVLPPGREDTFVFADGSPKPPYDEEEGLGSTQMDRSHSDYY